MSSNSKQLPASKKKLRKAREDGDVAKSRDLSSLCVLTIGIYSIYALSARLDGLGLFLTKKLSQTHDFHTNNVLVSLAEALGIIGSVVLPVLLLVFLGVLVIEALQVGLYFRLSQCLPKLSRLGVISGCKRILGVDHPGSLPLKVPLEFLKILAYFCILGAALVVVFVRHGRELLAGTYASTGDIIRVLLEVSFSTTLVFLLVYAGLAAADYVYIRWRRTMRLRMDSQEFKKELRESEGDAQTRGMRKQVYRELLHHQIVQSVRRARVLVVGEGSARSDES